MTTLWEWRVKIGAGAVSHGRYVMFQMVAVAKMVAVAQMVAVAVSRQMFRQILALIAWLRAPPAPA